MILYHNIIISFEIPTCPKFSIRGCIMKTNIDKKLKKQRKYFRNHGNDEYKPAYNSTRTKIEIKITVKVSNQSRTFPIYLI